MGMSYRGMFFRVCLAGVLTSLLYAEGQSGPAKSANLAPGFWLLLAAACVLALAAWGALVRLFPKKGCRLAFEELSADKETRFNRSRVLTGLMLELLTPKKLSEDEFYMDIMPGTDEPGFSGLMPGFESTHSTSYEASDRPVKIAALEFVPRDVLTWFGWLRRPAVECIEGWLEHNAEGATASATYRRRRPFRSSVRRQWLFRQAGPEAREEVLSLLAAQIVVDLRKVDFTLNGRSYRALRMAMRTSVLDQGNARRPDPRVSARRQYLETALIHDPRNWIARFSLALELCKGGHPGEAVRHFELLEELLKKVLAAHSAKTEGGGSCQSESEAFQALFEHLIKYPACPYLIQFNKAIALAAYDEPARREEALGILQNLIPASACDPRALALSDGMTAQLGRKGAMELRLNALSAQANIIATYAWRHGEFTTADAAKVKCLLEEVERICLAEQDVHWTSFQTARAVVHAAHARALADAHEAQGTVAALQSALAARPTFGGARLQMAEAYLVFRQELARDWAHRAEEELRIAMQLNQNCKQIRSLLAALYSGDALDKKAEAERIYRQLGELPTLSLWFGRFIVNSRASECPAMFALHQYLSTCSGVNPANRKRLEALAALRKFEGATKIPEFSETAETARMLLDEIAAAEVALPAGLIDTARKQLGLPLVVLGVSA